MLGSWNFKAPFYVAGFLVFVGAVMGRLVCGWLCPFGLIQELLHKIPFPKKIRTFRGDRLLRKAKYVIFVLFVVLLPLCLVDALGQGSPYFCKLLCPVGALEGGLPLVLLNKGLRATIGWLYAWKICPLGAVYSLFNPVSLVRYRVDADACVSCGKCAKVCGMGCDPVKQANDPECIRCGDCKRACPTQAIHSGCRK